MALAGTLAVSVCVKQGLVLFVHALFNIDSFTCAKSCAGLEMKTGDKAA